MLNINEQMSALDWYKIITSNIHRERERELKKIEDG